MQTSDSNLILQSVETFSEIEITVNEDDESTMITDSTEHKTVNLKNFWPKWKWDSFKFLLLKYGINENLNLNGEVFNDIFKTNNKHETHAACVYLSKIHDLILIKVNQQQIFLYWLFFFNLTSLILFIRNLILPLIWSKNLKHVE